LYQVCQCPCFGMKVSKYSLFVKETSDFHPKLAARQAEDFNQESSHSPARSVSLFAYLPTCLEITVTISPSIVWKNASSHKAKSWRKGCDKKQGHSRRCCLQEPRELRKNPFENKMLVWSSSLANEANHKRNSIRL
jgi:hypothetical protein